MTIDIRTIKPEELDAYMVADAAGFGYAVPDRPEDARALLEPDRSLAAFDGEEIVSTASAFSLQMTVPGAVVPTAGVTWVSVKPTHRRRGILRRMMAQQLQDIRDRGEAVAALWASESLIYGRFGYGVAALGADYEIKRPWTEIGHGRAGEGRLRLVSRDQALAAWPAVYESAASEQPGMYSRTETWWKHKLLPDQPQKPEGPQRFFVQYEEGDGALGYANYTVEGHWSDRNPDGTLHVDELIASTEGAYTALWRYIFGVDLVSTYRMFHRRPEEPLLWMLTEPRRLSGRTYDSLWLRIVDVLAALEARRYAAEGTLTLEVRDEFCPWVEGRYRLEGGPDGARCTPSDGSPDLVMSAADLASIYLGGPRVRTLHRAGRIEGDAEAVQRADALFGWHVDPWCPEVF